MKRLWLILSMGVAALAFAVPDVGAQPNQTGSGALLKGVPKVLIESDVFNAAAVQQQLSFIEHVADPSRAQVHVRISARETDSEKIFTLVFTGRAEFNGLNDQLTYKAGKNDAEKDVQAGLVRTLKMGLMSYVVKTDEAGRMSIGFEEKVKPTSVVDPWNFWVFRLNGDLYLNGEKSWWNRSISGSISANRITPEMKIDLSVSASSTKKIYHYEGLDIEGRQDSKSFSGLFVKSLSEHWSAGAYLEANSSTYQNLDLEIIPAPALEFNLFPYSQSTKRQFRILYRLGFNFLRYREETVYHKMKETLIKESLSATYQVNEKWGSMSLSLAGSNYFHDFGKNRLSADGMLQLRVFKGISVSLIGGVSKIRDQLSLTEGCGSLADVLLRLRQQKTDYSVFMMAGVSLSFGSVGSNVVNPRFGASSGMGMMRIIVN